MFATDPDSGGRGGHRDTRRSWSSGGCCGGARAAGSGPATSGPSADIRGTGGGPVAVVEAGTGSLIGTVDGGNAHGTVHEGAVYLHQGRSVRRRPPGPRRTRGPGAPGRPAVDHDRPRRHRHRASSRPSASRRYGPLTVSLGTVDVTNQVVGYLRRRLGTGELIDETPLDLPARELRTAAVWYSLPQTVLDEVGLVQADVPGRRARRRARRDRAAAAVRDLRPLGHRRGLDCAAPGHRAADRLRLRRAPGRGRLRRARLRHAAARGSAPRTRRSRPANARPAARRASSRRSAATATTRWTRPARSPCSSSSCRLSRRAEAGWGPAGRRAPAGACARADRGPADQRQVDRHAPPVRRPCRCGRRRQADPAGLQPGAVGRGAPGARPRNCSPLVADPGRGGQGGEIGARLGPMPRQHGGGPQRRGRGRPPSAAGSRPAPRSWPTRGSPACGPVVSPAAAGGSRRAARRLGGGDGALGDRDRRQPVAERVHGACSTRHRVAGRRRCTSSRAPGAASRASARAAPASPRAAARAASRAPSCSRTRAAATDTALSATARTSTSTGRQAASSAVTMPRSSRRPPSPSYSAWRAERTIELSADDTAGLRTIL